MRNAELQGDRLFPRRFALVRRVDYTGVTGGGVVAYGVQFADGQVVLRGLSERPATSMWSSMDDVVAVHGQEHDTEVQWIDRPEDALNEVIERSDGRRRRSRRSPDARDEKSRERAATNGTPPSAPPAPPPSPATSNAKDPAQPRKQVNGNSSGPPGLLPTAPLPRPAPNEAAPPERPGSQRSAGKHSGPIERQPPGESPSPADDRQPEATGRPRRAGRHRRAGMPDPDDLHSTNGTGGRP